jgi:hypothetical protein
VIVPACYDHVVPDFLEMDIKELELQLLETAVHQLVSVKNKILYVEKMREAAISKNFSENY